MKLYIFFTVEQCKARSRDFGLIKLSLSLPLGWYPELVLLSVVFSYSTNFAVVLLNSNAS